MSFKRDIVLLFGARLLRLFAYGFLSVILVLYLSSLGLPDQQIGFLLSATLLGDAGISLWITTVADRFGRRRMLILGSLLMIGAGAAFLLSQNFFVLTAAAIIGVISPSGNEIGPFLSIEQAALSEILSEQRRTHVFAWYNLTGSFATALGALGGGFIAKHLQENGFTDAASYQVLIAAYAAIGCLLALVYLRMPATVEVRVPAPAAQAAARRLGLHRSRGIVFKISSLFALDAFAGGFVIQSMLAYWCYLRFGADVRQLGSIFFGANLLAGVSSLLAARLASRFGLLNTMVFTHIPSNILLILVPLMPNLTLAVAVLLARFSISQMDVPTRQSYLMAVVDPDERSAASGVTTIARSLGASASPSLCGYFLSHAMLGLPFFLSGGLKIVYDVLLLVNFRKVKGKE
jgi:MFS family permease